MKINFQHLLQKYPKKTPKQKPETRFNDLIKALVFQNNNLISV